MDDLLNKTRYNNLIRPATSSSQLISIRLELSLAQLISVVGVEAAGARDSGEDAGGGFRAPARSQGKEWPFSAQGWESGDGSLISGIAQISGQGPRFPSFFFLFFQKV